LTRTLTFLLLFYDIGCVGLLLETINPFLEGSSPILNHALKIVELLGAYRFVISHKIPCASLQQFCFVVSQYMVTLLFVQAVFI
jgi:hypothetical protein